MVLPPDSVILPDNTRPLTHNGAVEPIAADCIITAAGLSSRMGCWKMMLPYLATTIVDVSIKNALLCCQRVILVVGYRGQELMELYQHHPRIQIVNNRHYQQGMFSSIQCGTSAVSSDYFFITHGDMPTITPDLYSCLWQQRGPYALLPCYQGQQGHPVLLPSLFKDRILNAAPSSTMRTLLRTGEHRLVPVESVAICRDIDTEGDYQRLMASP